MDVHELILRTRTCRRFRQNSPVSMETLRDLVEMARVAQSPWNQQAIKFILCNDPETNAQIFTHLQWASRMPDWAGPAEGERPAAYIVIVADKELGKLFNYDHPVAGTAILLGATEKGLAGCLVGAFSRKGTSTVLELSELVKALEEKFGVEAAAPMMMAGVAPAAAGAEAADEGPSSFDAILAEIGSQKIQVIKEVRAITGLGLKEAKDLVDKCPNPIKEDLSEEEAKEIREKIEAVGGTVEIKGK